MDRLRRRGLVVAVAAMLGLVSSACLGSGTGASDPRAERRERTRGDRALELAGDPDAYRGLGTWVDIYDDGVWARPEAAASAVAARGVRTVYLQTSNFHRGRPFVHREGVVRFLDAAAEHGLRVVAWYLPGLRDVHLDEHRALAAIGLRTPAGNTFDSFALDIESAEVQRATSRTARLLNLSARIRRAVGEDYPLGAIVPSPRAVRTNGSYWPGFPYRELAGLYDVFLPMTYFTWRVSGREGAGWYTAKNVLILRQETAGLRVPIHVIGGIASDATVQETRGFAETIRERDVIGASYYTFPLTRDDQWPALRSIS